MKGKRHSKAHDIAIVIPVYNSAVVLQQLHEQLEQLREQCEATIQLIYIDDASTDGSASVLNGLQLSPSDKVVLNTQNLGQQANSRKGMSLANAEILITIDDDLAYQPAQIARLVESYKQKNIQVCYGIHKSSSRSERLKRLILNVLLGKGDTSSFKLVHSACAEAYCAQNRFKTFEAFEANRVEPSQRTTVEIDKSAGNQSNYTLFSRFRLLLKFLFEFRPEIRQISLVIISYTLAVVLWLSIKNTGSALIE